MADALLQETDDPAAVAPVRLEELEHAVVVAPGLAGEGPRDEIGEVVVADADGVGVSEVEHTSIRAALRATRRTVSERFCSTPRGWKAYDGSAAILSGDGNRRSLGGTTPEGPGAGSPYRRTSPA